MNFLPSITNNQVSHYYVDEGGVQGHSANNEVTINGSLKDEALPQDDPHIEPGTTLILVQILRIPIDKVAVSKSTKPSIYI